MVIRGLVMPRIMHLCQARRQSPAVCTPTFIPSRAGFVISNRCTPPTFPSRAGWLGHCERLPPRAIDMGLERVREVARRMALRFDCPVITVAGTNGKGSTCAMLEAVAL